VSLLFPENSIEIHRGQSKTLSLTVSEMLEDGTSKPVDLTGATVYFSVKVSETDQQPLFQKISTSPSQIEITTPRLGKVRIYLEPADTKTLDPHEYKFDIWAVLASGKRYPVVPPSTFLVKPGVTRLP
jgi:hypothetical protein